MSTSLTSAGGRRPPLRPKRKFAGADVCAEAITVATRRLAEIGGTVKAWEPVPVAQASLLGVG